MPITPCPIPCQPCAPPIGGNGIAHLGLNPLDPNNPYVNLSAEEPDADLFIGRRYQPPIIGEPPLGDTWYAAGCLGFCFSNTSQEDADLCAAQQAVLCVAGNWPDPQPPIVPGGPPVLEPRATFTNSAQFCSFTCPDGSLFTFTVNAGLFTAFSQAAANAMAYAYACQRAVVNRLCPGPLSRTSGCVAAPFLSVFGVATSHVPVNFEIIAGDIPTGLGLSQSTNAMFISGNPTATGAFTFTVRATDSIGAVIEKEFTIQIYGLVTASPLDDAAINEAYSVTLVPSSNLTGTLTYSIVGGSLPTGVTLNSSTGEISGTPTVDGAYQFGVRVSNGTVTCDKTFDLFVVEAVTGCDFFSGLIWGGVETSGSGGNWSASGTFIGNTFNSNASGTFEGEDSAYVRCVGTAAYEGEGLECCVLYVFSGSGNAGYNLLIQHSSAGVILDITSSDSGSGSWPFTIPASAPGDTITVTITSSVGAPDGASAALAGTIGGC